MSADQETSARIAADLLADKRLKTPAKRCAVLARSVRVRHGITDGSYTEIIGGLQEGDSVITSMKLPEGEAAEANGGRSPLRGLRLH